MAGVSQLNQRRSGGTEANNPASERTAQSRRPRRSKNSFIRSQQHQQQLQQTIFVSVVVILVSVWFLLSLMFAKHTVVYHGVRSAASLSSPHHGTATYTTWQHMTDPDTHAEKKAASGSSNSSSNNNNDTTDDRRGGGATKIRLIKLESQSIDMRQLNRYLPFANPDGGAWKQGWDVQPKPYSKDAPLNVFVLPHSHCDPGWIKTFDEYFQQQTKHILTTVVTALQLNPKRKFIWAEISYFEWWYREQEEPVKQAVKLLLQRNQLEFVTGGWVQPDEANTELYAMEVQLQEGHDWIKETFGEKYIPQFGWSIDPFGYSPTMAYLLEKYGFKGMLIQRVHYAVKKELAQKQHLEFMWRQTWDETGEHDIFTHVMPFYSYDVPHTCGPDPSVCCQFDFARLNKFGGCPWHKNPKEITDENVHERSMLLIDQWQKKAALYRSNTVLSPLGDDFRYMDSVEAEAQYTNFEKMFEYINANVPGVTAQFGTLSEYFHSVMGQFAVPILKGSFFTYSDREQDYWSGYFTSRVFDKALDRKLERVLYAADSLGATNKELQAPRRSLSLFQHHDGVAGTAKTYVVQDYAQIMHTAIHQTQDWILKEVAADQPDFRPCWQSDAPRGLSQNLCGKAQGVIVYNPLGTSQHCGNVEVAGHSSTKADYPCEYPGPVTNKVDLYQFEDGLMTHPIKESWQVWKVKEGGAYLFFPGTLEEHSLKGANVTDSGWVVDAGHWKRSLIEKKVSDEFGNTAHVLDFIFETNLKSTNEEWFVRFSSGIQNDGVFHTDLNGFNFDTHHFRADMPIQSQVFPMPTLASIQDGSTRMTIISEHAQGTASLENGSIDVWLDRRLSTDDNRGVGQGVMDNVPTRTKLRVVLEYEGFSTNGEFDITPLCRRMWDELNHPLEAFGKLTFASAAAVTGKTSSADDDTFEAPGMDQGELAGFKYIMKALKTQTMPPKVTITAAIVNDASPIVPFVFMVYKRVDYLKEVIETLRRSDFDAARVPLIISVDGHVPEMMEYVTSLRKEFKVTQLIHEFACHDHPTTFPGEDPALNVGYKGDTYHNKRSWQITCCKHHFTWMLKTVFNLDMKADAFLFMEEDYTVSNNIYENILTSLALLVHGRDKDHLFGITLDPTDAASKPDKTYREDGWYVRSFVSGPMVLTRAMWDKIQSHAVEFCSYDDYNWDWSLVNLMNLKLIPRYVLTPTKLLVKHIGVEGMHGKSITNAKKLRMQRATLPVDFHGLYYFPLFEAAVPVRKPNPFGGWGHPMDQSHCIQVLTGGKEGN